MIPKSGHRFSDRSCAKKNSCRRTCSAGVSLGRSALVVFGHQMIEQYLAVIDPDPLVWADVLRVSAPVLEADLRRRAVTRRVDLAPLLLIAHPMERRPRGRPASVEGGRREDKVMKPATITPITDAFAATWIAFPASGIWPPISPRRPLCACTREARSRKRPRHG